MNKILLGVSVLLLLGLTTVFLVEKQNNGLRAEVDEFQAWMHKYGFKFADEVQLQYRRSIFYQNKDLVEQLNSENNGTFHTLNAFAIYTKDEFNQLFKGYQKRQKSHLIYSLKGDVAPSIDWRQKNAVTPVKNQGQCGSCWAFSTVGGLEGAYAIATGNLTSFSEQQIVDCSKANAGCNGGDLPPAYKYVVQNGIETEADYPYKGVNQKCAYDASKVVFKPKSFVQVTPNSPDQLAIALNKEPVPICIEADQKAFQFYTSGIISSGCGTNLDHCVLAVGYDADSWIVKNSWGASWGENGYVRIARTTAKGPGVCGIYEEPVYPIY
ncbi:papain family cysteine protease (macronuclear) [Tetrahymena thermophila SB210]|uniref:Papain family cysteine protease n=1 Tax=Tetrahymena thermophila (strain SB210) TaxID=312017 RepID=Q22W19_TETTS|nr:papain family cysteine protease [Tetrahymena thermophila SB210]EAR89598.3 papain family cysteine protease [Tetrahymena thermophila SB210]|eukprot:XP_001009843.3 papain family cysteine protease [Tetrahymena thermophila SB210]